MSKRFIRVGLIVRSIATFFCFFFSEEGLYEASHWAYGKVVRGIWTAYDPYFVSSLEGMSMHMLVGSVQSKA